MNSVEGNTTEDDTYLFRLGSVIQTQGVIEVLAEYEGKISAGDLIHRHASGDWGDLDEKDVQFNNLALKNSGRLFSKYELSDSDAVYVITESDRSVTTLLLPSEY